jgi:hypothetical protein
MHNQWHVYCGFIHYNFNCSQIFAQREVFMVMVMIVLFAIAATGGIILAALHFGNKTLPLWLALLHGLVAVSGVIILLVALMKLAAIALLGVGLALFAIAAVGGLTLFIGFYVPKKRLPSPIVILHALFAVAGFAMILVYALSH